jgi:L-rhamnose mutarotase
MQRICFCLQVKPERLAEYKLRHCNVWPEMLQALSTTGWKNYSLFLLDDGLLIGYLETENFDDARAAMAKTEINAKWQTEMAPFFADAAGKHADEQMRPLTEVFHLD